MKRIIVVDAPEAAIAGWCDLMRGGGYAVELLAAQAGAAAAGASTEQTLGGQPVSLSQRKDLLRAIFDSAPQCIKLLAADGTLLEMNEAGLRMLEADSFAQVAKQCVYPMVAPEYRGAFEALTKRTFAGETVTLEFEIVGLKGTRRWLETHAVPLRDDQGVVTSLLGVTSDITERHEATLFVQGQKQVLEMIALGAPLEESLAALTRVIEARSPEMLCSVLLLDDDGRRLRHGAAPSLPTAYIQGVDGASIGPAEGSCGTAAFRREAVFVADIETDPLWENYRHLARAHGLRACWSAPIFDAHKKVLGTFAIYYRRAGLPTASERELIEIATQIAAICISRKREEAALRDSEELFHTLAIAAPVGIYRADATGACRYVNERWCEIAGMTAEASRGLGWQQAVHPEDRERVSAQWQQQIQTGEIFKAEYRFMRPDGETTWVYGQALATKGATGEVTGYIGTVTDITERKSIEEQLRHSQKMEAIGQLAGGVAHDFNNILTIIHGNAALLMASDMDPETVTEHATQVIDAAERAANLTRQLLLFSRKQVMQPVSLDMNKVVAEVTSMLQRILGEDITLRAEYAPHMKPIRADSGMIEQILLNLAVNSRDAMPAGGMLTIQTALETLSPAVARQTPGAVPGDVIRLSVSDTGCGIPPEVLPRIFEPFFTTKEVGKGTGLGLATVYGIVQQHRGWMRAVSEPGCGAAFHIYFPALREREQSAKSGASNGTGTGGNETLLVVEDEPALRKLVGNLLQRHGYDVLLATTGVTALKVWNENKHRIHLLLTDMVMPDGMSGKELATRCRMDKPQLKVIYTSGYSEEILGVARDPHDSMNFLQKPYHPDRLASMVRNCLDGK